MKDNWKEIQEKLKKQLAPYPEIQQRLAQAGAPISPEEIGISREYLKQTFVRTQYIRRRFTILDVAVRTHMQDEWLEQLFGKNGIWEIKQS